MINRSEGKKELSTSVEVLSRPVFKKIGIEEKTLFVPVDRLAELQQAIYDGRALEKCKPAYRGAVFLLNACFMAYFAPTRDNLDIPISVSYATLFCGKGAIWKKVRKLLEGLGAIICDEKMKVGKKCFVYRLTDDWARSSTWRKSSTFQDWPVISSPQQSLPYLSIDVPEALELLERTYPMRRVQGKSVIDQRTGERRLRLWEENNYRAYKDRIEHFCNRYSIVQTGRLYTMANGLPKELRQALRIHGEHTVEVDVKCCQPLLTSVLYKRDSPEKFKYLHLVQTGDVYATVRDAVRPNMDRNVFKQEHFIPWLFGSSETTNECVPEIEAWFEKEFPELMARIREIGSVSNSKNKNARNPKALPRYLQKLESKAIWQAVEAAGIPAVSIHDGVRVRPCDLERTLEVLMNSFESLYNLKPQIEISDVLKELNLFETIVANSKFYN